MNENINSGFLLIDKPKGITSFAVISQLRRITGIKKIGHAGTLDPLATGVLIVAVGREATRTIAKCVGMDKVYQAKIRLGAVSDTYDGEGKIMIKAANADLKLEQINQVLDFFIGEQEQIPPMYSAKKVNGEKLYNLARRGEIIARKPCLIKIFSLKILNYRWPILDLEVHCSSGTYIRSLAFDLGEKLGVGGYLEELRRIRIGDFAVDGAIKLDEINENNWRDFLLTI